MRKIHFSDEEVWEYKIGRSFIEIRDPDRKKYVASKISLMNEVLGANIAEAYKTVYPEFYSGADDYRQPEKKLEIRPSHIKEYIEKTIKCEKFQPGS